MNQDLKKEINEVQEIKQLDFEHDNMLFIDPYRIDERKGELYRKAKIKIIKYFDIFFNCIVSKDESKVLYLGKHLHEINATKLGYTCQNKKPCGKGFSQNDLFKIYTEGVKVKEYINDMPDVFILANNIGADKISDITTNIIYEELLEYTKYIILKYDIHIEMIKTRKYIYNVFKEKWELILLDVPIIEGEEILFLPEDIVESYEIFSYSNVYKKLVYPYYKTNIAIHHLIKVLKSGEIKPDCKKIKERYPLKRETVREFKKLFPNEYERFKKDIQRFYWYQ